MNTAEKLRFLADRAEDGKEFYIISVEKIRALYAIKEGKLYCLSPDRESILTLNRMTEREFEIKPQWSFTEDEKVILRNTPQEYLWIARDNTGDICVYSKKPIKIRQGMTWDCSVEYNVKYLEAFEHIFQSIQWEDEEPCEFRRYI